MQELININIVIGSGSNSDYYAYNGTRYMPCEKHIKELIFIIGKNQNINFVKGKNSFKKDIVSDDFFNNMKAKFLKYYNV